MAKSTKPAAKKTAPAKSAEKSASKKNKSTTASDPTVNTDLAAAAAARSLMARIPTKTSPASIGQQTHTESSMFKQLKSGMAKPAGQAMSNLLDKHGGPMQKSSHEGFGSGGPQQGKNQVFGADVNRAGVPRRTGGG